MAQEYLQIAMQGVIAAGGSNAKTIVNIFHFRRTSTVGAISKQNISDAFQADIGDVILAAIQADYTQQYNIVRFFDDALDWAAPFAQAGVGAIATARSPDYVAAVVRYKANINSRSGKASNHYAPIAEADTDGDVLTSGAITRFTAVGDAYLLGFTDSDGNTWLPVVKSSKFGANYATNPTTVVTFPIQQRIVNHSLGIMRRRKANRV
jgi:hypothetical protein